MIMPILTTKLYIPVPRPKAVLRRRLIERLNEGLDRKLTLISAPAGFGKTTVVSEWIAECDRPTAWLSLDEGENDPTRFLTYLVAALRTIAATIDDGLLTALQSPQPPTAEIILTALLNEMTALPQSFILVLDDYHLTDAKSVDDILTFLLEHLPSQMHLVIITREDPNLPLARLRVRNQLIELRAADLRFTPGEAAEFLNQVMGLSLRAEDIAALESRTEGWIAGLQLAALSMQGRSDIAQFVRTFAGNNRYIVDYLVDEVLQRQPDHLRNFLLQTAILDQLTGSLCDAVTGQKESSERLEILERGNFFVVPLDDKRYWYRYHHLFADVLYAHLVAEQPYEVADLHRRASVWYGQNNLTAEAIHHALAAKDFELAADLIEQALQVMRSTRQEAILLRWFQRLPDTVLRYRPVLNVAYAHVLLSNGMFEGVADHLWNAEQCLGTTGVVGERSDRPTTPMIVLDDEAFRRLRGMIGLARAGLAMAQGDVPNVVTYARQALDLAPEDDYMTRGGAAGFLGLAAWTHGDFEEAHRTFAAGMASLQKAGFISDAINGANTLAAIRTAQGRLREAMHTYERGLHLATGQGTLALRGAADMYVGMSEIYREWNDLDTATQHLLKSRELGEHAAFPQNRYRWYVAMARILYAQGDSDGALENLNIAEQLYMSDFSPNIFPIAALKARIWIEQGILEEELDWVREQGISIQNDLSYVREFEHITLVRLLLARYTSDSIDSWLHEAADLLDRLLQAAEARDGIGSVIEILILQALIWQIQGDIQSALIPLERALTLAEPENYIRIFVDEGLPMERLIRDAATRKVMPKYTDRLLEAFAKPREQTGSVHLSATLVSQPLVEPLSQRELEILRLFNTDLSGPDIARELMVALSTIRTHTKSIYSKLNVNSRRAAIKRADELNLI